jgi:hypothetical protein
VKKVDAPPDQFNYALGGAFDCFGDLHFREFSLDFSTYVDKQSFIIPLSRTADGWIREPGTYHLIVSFKTDGTSSTYTAAKEFLVQ